MELRLQKFISSMGLLSDIRNLDPSNPVSFNLEHPVTATRFVTIASIAEPSYMGIPIHTTWTVLDPQSQYYLQALKLRAWAGPWNTIPGMSLVPGMAQSWTVVNTYDEIFADPQFYDNGSGGGVAGPQGIQGIQGPVGLTGPGGPQGIAGPRGLVGPPQEIDYEYIIAQVLLRLPVAPTGVLTIVGPATLGEGQTAQYTATLTVAGVTTPVIVPFTLTGVGATITAQGALTSGQVASDSPVVLSITYSYNGVTLTANKTVTVTNATLASLAMTGLPANVIEGQTATLVVTATFSDGTTSVVTPASTFVASPTLATVLPSTGVLTAGAVTVDTAMTVTASYTIAGVTRTASQSTTVKNIIVASLAITGVASVNEGTAATYIATATYSDGTSGVVTPVWTLSSPALGTINTGGVLSAAMQTANLGGNVLASFTLAGIAVTATKAITVANLATVVYPYFGAAPTAAVINEALITGLAQRGTTATRVMSTLQIIDSPTTASYYAYPASYGPAIFTDLGNMFQGGWDGANKDVGTTLGPVTVPVMVDGVSVNFYVYQTDYPNISPLSNPTNWAVS